MSKISFKIEDTGQRKTFINLEETFVYRTSRDCPTIKIESTVCLLLIEVQTSSVCMAFYSSHRSKDKCCDVVEVG